MFRQKFYVLLIVSALLLGCNEDPLKIDSSGIIMELTKVNIDSVIWHADEQQLSDFHEVHIEKSEPYQYILGHCLGIQNPDINVVSPAISEFKADPYVQRLEKRLKENRIGINKKHNQVELAFRNLKFHLPKGNFPKEIWYANSMFASSVFSTDSEIVVGIRKVPWVRRYTYNAVAEPGVFLIG